MTVYVMARTPAAAQEAIKKYATKPANWKIIRSREDLPDAKDVHAPVIVLVGEWYWKHPDYSRIFDGEYFTKVQAKMIYSEELDP